MKRAPDANGGAPASRFVRGRLLWAKHFTRDGFVSSLLWAALGGFCGALVTMLFRAAIASLVRLETGGFPGHISSNVGGLVEAARSLPPGWRVALPAAGGLLAGTLLWLERRRSGRDAGGDYMESVVIGDGVVPVRKSLVRSVSSLFTIASGGSIGREGPMVQLAAAAASLVAQAARMRAPQRRLLVACGAAAGLTAAYNAPLAGALFVAEIVLGSIAIDSLVPLLVAAMVGNLTTHVLAPDVPLYPIALLAHPRAIEYAAYAAIGAAAGLAGPLFLASVDRTRRAVERLALPLPFALAIGGLFVGLISLRMPEIWGNGYSTINAILAGRWVGAALVLLLVLKVAATASTVGSGAIGGIFTPTLFVGAALGALITQSLAAWLPAVAPPAEAGTAVAMGAFLAATTQAPLTSILMVLEMTGAPLLVLPLMLAAAVAYLVVRLVGAKPLYAAADQRRQRDAAPFDLTAAVSTLQRPAPPTLSEDDSNPVVVAAFATWRFQSLYVVDAAGAYRGSISLHDLRRRMESGDPATADSATAKSLTTAVLPVLRDDMTLLRALEIFRTHRGERLPVTDASGRLVGALWKTDLLLELQQRLTGAR